MADPKPATVTQTPGEPFVSNSPAAQYQNSAQTLEAQRLKASAEPIKFGERGGVSQAEVDLMNEAIQQAGGTLADRQTVERIWTRDMTAEGLTAAIKAQREGTIAPIVHAGNLAPSYDPMTMDDRPALATPIEGTVKLSPEKSKDPANTFVPPDSPTPPAPAPAAGANTTTTITPPQAQRGRGA